MPSDSTKAESPPKGNWLKKISEGLNKISNLKPLIIILVLLVVAVVVLNMTSSTKKTSKTASVSNSNFTTSFEYIKQIEQKLGDVVSGIKGAGKTKVMISISSSPALELAHNVEEKTVTTSSGTTTTKNTEPIIVTKSGESSPLILRETLPEITGVIVVSAGAKDVKVKMDIILAVATALGIGSNIVEVFAGT